VGQREERVRKKILIIDDEPGIIDMLKVRLEANAFEVLGAADGEEGLDKVIIRRPDLIILDVMMPQMDGYSFLLELKKIPGGGDIPVIVLTGKDRMEEIFKLEGIEDYLHKPFEPEQLIGKIRKYL
jgi:CheY-like chemotaxis protein